MQHTWSSLNQSLNELDWVNQIRLGLGLSPSPPTFGLLQGFFSWGGICAVVRRLGREERRDFPKGALLNSSAQDNYKEWNLFSYYSVCHITISLPFYYMHIHACMCMYIHVHVYMWAHVWKSEDDLLFPSAMCLPGMELRSSGLVASPFSLCAGPHNHIVVNWPTTTWLHVHTDVLSHLDVCCVLCSVWRAMTLRTHSSKQILVSKQHMTVFPESFPWDSQSKQYDA